MALISFTISDSTFVLRVRSDAVSCCVMCIVHIWVLVLYFGDKKYWAQGSLPADVKRFLLKIEWSRLLNLVVKTGVFL